MKKLIIFNHLGQKELEFDVFMEGQDFCTSFPTPKCIWLGQIVIADKEPEPEPAADFIPIHTAALIGVITKEVEHELETVSNTSGGDSGTGTPDEPESLEKLPEQLPGGKARKRGKRVRDSKAT